MANGERRKCEKIITAMAASSPSHRAAVEKSKVMITV